MCCLTFISKQQDIAVSRANTPTDVQILMPYNSMSTMNLSLRHEVVSHPWLRMNRNDHQPNTNRVPNLPIETQSEYICTQYDQLHSCFGWQHMDLLEKQVLICSKTLTGFPIKVRNACDSTLSNFCLKWEWCCLSNCGLAGQIDMYQSLGLSLGLGLLIFEARPKPAASPCQG